jgi:uncharacterized UPF0160 family protein
MEKAKTICTHSGAFHCDEALAVFMLKQTAAYRDARITRSRDPEVWKLSDLLVDVGDVYDESKQRFDHHQRGFSETLDNDHKIKLSSAGLIYKHFGREVILNLSKVATPKLDVLYYRLYTNFIEALDAIDNGVSQFDKTEPQAPKYSINTHLAARVGNLNPAWNDKTRNADDQFWKAVELTGLEFKDALFSIVNIWLPAREVVENAIANRLNIDPKGRIILLDVSCPWKQHLFDLEAELKIGGQIQYALFKDVGESWRVQSVPLSSDSFENRSALPEPWRGKRAGELSEITGVPGCVFCHHSGFIGGTETKEQALQLALVALSVLGK